MVFSAQTPVLEQVRWSNAYIPASRRQRAKRGEKTATTGGAADTLSDHLIGEGLEKPEIAGCGVSCVHRCAVLVEGYYDLRGFCYTLPWGVWERGDGERADAVRESRSQVRISCGRVRVFFYRGKISFNADSILSTSSRMTRIDCWFFTGWANGVIPSRAPRI